MKYTVAWTPNAEQQLAAVWMSCADRRAVSAAATEIDALLSNNPDAVGWPRRAAG